MPGYNQAFLQEDQDKKREKSRRGRIKAAQFNLVGAQQYLDDCSYSVDLESLYTMNQKTGTCAYNEEMEFVPTQIEVKCPSLHHKAKILLQVWNSKGVKVFQKKLQQAIT